MDYSTGVLNQGLNISVEGNVIKTAIFQPSGGWGHVDTDFTFETTFNGVNNTLTFRITNVKIRHYSFTANSMRVWGSIAVNGVTIWSATDGQCILPSSTSGGVFKTCTGASSTWDSSVEIPCNADSSLSATFSLNLSTNGIIIVNGTERGWDYAGTSGNVTTTLAPSHSHNYTPVVTSPTCIEQGYTTYKCYSCGDSYISDYTSALGHNWTDATCTLPKTCSRCNITEGSPLGHSWDGGVITIPPTYESDGIRTHTCRVCEETRQDIITKSEATIYIDNGFGFDGYGIYIDNGKEWEAYGLYIDNGISFIAYC